MFDLANLTLTDLLIAGGTLLLLVVLMSELFECSSFISGGGNGSDGSNCNNCGIQNYDFGYTAENGPLSWANCYADVSGCYQSPINIDRKQAAKITAEPLKWSGFKALPCSMTMFNDGTAVVVCATFPNCSSPSIQGGPLITAYDFYSMVFHWGPSDEEGSEHTIDYVRYPMELQMVHLKRGLQNPEEAICKGDRDGMAIVAFFFEIIHCDNPYVDYIVSNLMHIQSPNTKVDIPQFPLEWIFPPFESCFYHYSGSLTQPPCTEIASWIIQPQPIGISVEQMRQFRKLCSVDGPMVYNTRPVQYLNDREVYFYE